MPANANINRVATMISQYESNIAQRLALGQTTQERVDALHKTLNMELGEFCRFQQLKSLACAGGMLTVEEAQTIYAHLGESLDHFNSRPIAVKAVLTKVFEELLEMQVRNKRRTG